MNLCWISFICYLGAISFQLAGAVLLLVQYCFKSIESQLKSIAVKRTHLDGSVLYLGETKPNDCELVEEIWSNRLAFLYIALGYFVSIFGDPLDINKLLIALIIVWKRHMKVQSNLKASLDLGNRLSQNGLVVKKIVPVHWTRLSSASMRNSMVNSQMQTV